MQKPLVQCFGVFALLVTAMAVVEDSSAAASSTADDLTAAEPSLYSTAFLPPKPVAVQGPLQHDPYGGAVASTSTNIVRTPGNLGRVAAFQTVETPYSSAHKSDVRYTNDVQPYYPGSYPYAGPYPYASTGPYPYASTGSYPYAPTGPYPYAPVTVAAGPYPYAAATGPYAYAPTGPYPYTPADPIKPYGYGPAAAPYTGYGPVSTPVGPQTYAATAPIVIPHSATHTSFSGPYRAHYSYKR